MNRKCSVDGCGRDVDVKMRGWCMLHYRRWHKYGDPTIARKEFRLPAICSVEGCTNRPIAKRLCERHYALNRRNGEPVRTRVFSGEYVKDGYRYVMVGRRRYEPEHRLVMQRFLGRLLHPHEHIHHIDGDTINNSPSNLAIVSRSEHLKIHIATRQRGKAGRFVRG